MSLRPPPSSSPAKASPSRPSELSHVVLLGDAILDNGAYTLGGPVVISQVRELLPFGWRASLLAVDGSTTDDVPKQLTRLPADATHLALSVGGNDALMHAGLFVVDRAAKTVKCAGRYFSGFREEVSPHSHRLHSAGTSTDSLLHYNGCLADKDFQRLASTALMVFNDVILRVGIEFGLSVIDLRFVCSLPEDYANPIEPSSSGRGDFGKSKSNAPVPEL